MDYEKKYNEALEQAKKLSVDGYLDAIAVEEIFPELRESEDERIRKWLIDYFSSIKATVWIHRDISCEQILAYLEKQKEQEHICDSAQYEEGFKTGLEIGLRKQKEQKVDIDKLRRDIYQSGYNDGYQHGKEDAQKEQKPAEWRPFDKEVLTKIKELIDSHFSEHVQRGVYKDWLDEHISQPAEWSEEDADMLNCCISSIEEAKENRYAYKETDGDTSYDREIDWLKSLRPQPKKGLHPGSIRKVDNPMKWMEEDEKEREQKPVTWSEEDEKIISSIRHILFEHAFENGGVDVNGDYCKDVYSQANDFLLSLRPSWKPSEEQMDSLRDTIVQTKGYSYSMYLPELYEQLKKL